MQTTRTVLEIAAALMLAIPPAAPARAAGETLRASRNGRSGVRFTSPNAHKQQVNLTPSCGQCP
jgi:hypothetical protein